MKKIIVAVILISCLLSTFMVSVNAFDMKESMGELEPSEPPVQYSGDNDEIVLTFSFDEPVITEINRDGDTYTQVAIEELPITGDTGVPLLPVKPVNVLLPQRTMVESITITKGEAIVLGEGYNIELGVEPTVIGMVSGEELVETVIGFDPMVLYPLVDFENVGVFDFRGYSVLTLVVYPVRYLGSTGELSYFDEITVTITTVDVDDVNPLFRGSPKDEMMMREMVDDYTCSNTYVSVDQEDFLESLVISGDSYEYVIITNETLKNAAGEYTFQDLIEYKNNNGASATIVTVEEIYDQYDGVDNPEMIRNFIKDAYLNWGTEYVLLGGDIDFVPARFLYVGASFPSDLYYGCLDGPYNYDGDVRWGETNDGENGGDVDLRAEVYVGRACAGNDDEVSNFVMKTLAYEQTPVDDPYLKKALMVGAYLGFHGIADYGGNYLDELINGSDAHGYSTVGIPSEEYEIDTLYDRDWPSWPPDELLNRINAGVNIINHVGHGQREGWENNMWEGKMYNEHVLQLENTNYSFIYSQACFVGYFDEWYSHIPDCFAEYLTVKTSHGAFAVIMNAYKGYGRWYSTDGPSQRYHREFWDAIFNEGVRDQKKTCLGVANQDSKEDNLWRINEACMRCCYYELNLFGDPQVSLKPVPIPEHDIAVVSMELPESINPDENFDITVTIVNQGLYDETDISGKISIFEVIDTVNYEENLIDEDFWDVNFLGSGDETTIGFTHSLSRGLYRIRFHVNPVPNEDIIFNNGMTAGISALSYNSPPEKPARPEGPINGNAGVEYTYSTYTNDPEDDQLYYKWFWGYDPWAPYIEYWSVWLGRYDSGEIHYASFTWWTEGRYEIKVIAMDVYGAISEWSDPLHITMPKNYNNYNQNNQQNNQGYQQSQSQQYQNQQSIPLNNPLTGGLSNNN